MWPITSDLKQRQEEDAFAVNQKQGQHGGTDVAGFQSIQRERLFAKHVLHKSQEGKNTSTLNAVQESYVFFCLFGWVFLPSKEGYVTAGIRLSDI